MTDTKLQSIIGEYGAWAAGLIADPAELSFRKNTYTSLEQWRAAAQRSVWNCLGAPASQQPPQIEYVDEVVLDGVRIQSLRWQLSYGQPTEAVLLTPSTGTGPWPGVLGLHDHGGNKFLGWSKIAQVESAEPDYLQEHRANYYGGRAWANELAKRGYAVLVPDTFTFGSRRVRQQDMNGISWGDANPDLIRAGEGTVREQMNRYNRWASAHEHILAKSLFCAGTTWPAVFLREDQVALDLLGSMNFVDGDRLGCCGLSGGGLRSVYLGGLDERIRCSITVGFMSTWRDFLLNKSYTHTWMLYIPLLPRLLDFPEILGLRAPKGTMVLNNTEDQLFSLAEMQRADEMLRAHFDKAEAGDHYRCEFHSGLHKFDVAMQESAFSFLDHSLK